MKALLGIKGMGGDELSSLVDSAGVYASRVNAGERVDGTLIGVTVGTMFFEASTRTRLSFELAAQKLGAHVLTFIPEHSSMSKGETLQDTVLTVASMGVDVLIVRHATEGIPEAVHGWTARPVVNAGDGISEHPTQAIADCLTLKNRFGSVAGLSVAVVGDVAHSRVAGSLLEAIPVLGGTITLVGPSDLLPSTNLANTDEFDDMLGEADVVYLLRVQRERGAGVDDDYITRYQLGVDRAARMKPEAVVMHPGPINRGVEIAGEVADGPRSLILDQVANGVPARMAVLAAIGAEL